MNKAGTLGLLVILVSGCTDARWSKLTQFGGAQEITCYSGGQQIYHGFSTGKVLSEEGSDGYYFEEQGTGKVVEISADCIIRGAK
jgi:hypothetical protein